MQKDDTRIFVKPVGDASVPDPQRGFELLPKEGRLVEHTSYWQRRIEDGDVKIADEKEIKASKKSEG